MQTDMQDIVDQILGWELHKWSPTSALAFQCQIKGDLIRYVMANCSCTASDALAFDEAVRKQTMRFGALREYAEAHNEDFPMRHLSLLKQHNYKVMKHRYENTPYWNEINMYLGKIRKMEGL